MRRRLILPLIFGLGGVAILLSLGFWQVQRLDWKQAILSQIDAKIAANPVTLPDTPSPENDTYLPVRAKGNLTGEELHVLVSVKRRGAGYRVISVLDINGRRVMVDRGFIPADRKAETRLSEPVEITGNLHWPNEIDGYTPDPDIAKNIWFARDVPAMASALNAEPVLIVARTSSATTPPVEPLPIETANIPNDHLQYAITWFSLAFLWFVMTAYLLWRIRRRTV